MFARRIYIQCANKQQRKILQGQIKYVAGNYFEECSFYFKIGNRIIEFIRHKNFFISYHFTNVHHLRSSNISFLMWILFTCFSIQGYIQLSFAALCFKEVFFFWFYRKVSMTFFTPTPLDNYTTFFHQIFTNLIVFNSNFSLKNKIYKFVRYLIIC